MGKYIEILDGNNDKFAENLEKSITKDYKNNDRNRDYSGQPWTINGIRGKQEIKGITMRDLQDCIIQAMIICSDDTKLSKKVFEISKEFQQTEYATKGDWQPKDIYEIDFSKVDPMAIIQNVGCFVEHYMGIFPNTKIDGIPSTEELIKELSETGMSS